ncbi:formate dehydrogenase subunit delta [Halomonas sp. M4R5S39]|uniref:formate dehydrogenase subunit delta n=1 Tax=Halomonas kalidii TaxID=3043293 RepID=UPI0024A9F0C0|nr:formate dehydrogenase subunit delta [Halomonas kalidii]MDI5984298.1 formate dehydrogenase subunit delta [Halomonas kalidii]
MSLHNDAHLVRMANQIAANLSGGRREDEAVAGICHHLETFWARPMKRRLIACLEEENTELVPLARRAARQLAVRLAERKLQATGQVSATTQDADSDPGFALG